MNRLLTLCLLLFATALLVQAETAENRPLRPFIGLGLTFGGETIATVHYTDGSSSDLSSGGLFAGQVGLDYRSPDAPVSVRVSVGYQGDTTDDASNGSLSFDRIPVDVLGFYHLNKQWRVGGGLQYVIDPEVKGEGVASPLSTTFDNTLGVVVEGEYLLDPHIGLALRGVGEQFKAPGGASINGSHVGAFVNYYF